MLNFLLETLVGIVNRWSRICRNQGKSYSPLKVHHIYIIHMYIDIWYHTCNTFTHIYIHRAHIYIYIHRAHIYIYIWLHIYICMIIYIWLYIYDNITYIRLYHYMWWISCPDYLEYISMVKRDMTCCTSQSPSCRHSSDLRGSLKELNEASEVRGWSDLLRARTWLMSGWTCC